MRAASAIVLPLAAALVGAGCCQSGQSARVHASAHAAAPAAAAAAADDDEDADDGDEVRISLSDVPSGVLAAARGAIGGFTATGAERETENGAVVYCIEGTVNGRPYEVEVTADGRVIEVEEEDD